jgi:hypothetical protein
MPISAMTITNNTINATPQPEAYQWTGWGFDCGDLGFGADNVGMGLM